MKREKAISSLLEVESKLIKKSTSFDFSKMVTQEIVAHESQVKREAGETGFGVLIIADVRKEIVDGAVDQSPLTKCIRIFESNGYCIVVFIFQAFQGSPAQRT